MLFCMVMSTRQIPELAFDMTDAEEDLQGVPGRLVGSVMRLAMENAEVNGYAPERVTEAVYAGNLAVYATITEASTWRREQELTRPDKWTQAAALFTEGLQYRLDFDGNELRVGHPLAASMFRPQIKNYLPLRGMLFERETPGDLYRPAAVFVPNKDGQVECRDLDGMSPGTVYRNELEDMNRAAYELEDTLSDFWPPDISAVNIHVGIHPTRA